MINNNLNLTGIWIVVLNSCFSASVAFGGGVMLNLAVNNSNSSFAVVKLLYVNKNVLMKQGSYQYKKIMLLVKQ